MAAVLKSQTLLVDDHPLFRAGLALAIDREPDLQVAAEVGNSAEACDVLRRMPIDIAVIDVLMPKTNGISLATELLEVRHEVKILALSVLDEPVMIAAIGVRATMVRQDLTRRSLPDRRHLAWICRCQQFPRVTKQASRAAPGPSRSHSPWNTNAATAAVGNLARIRSAAASTAWLPVPAAASEAVAASVRASSGNDGSCPTTSCCAWPTEQVSLPVRRWRPPRRTPAARSVPPGCCGSRRHPPRCR